MRLGLAALIAAAVAAPAAAGTPRVQLHRVTIVAREPKPVVITIDDKATTLHVTLRKLPTTPPPQCKTDRRGDVRCAITY